MAAPILKGCDDAKFFVLGRLRFRFVMGAILHAPRQDSRGQFLSRQPFSYNLEPGQERGESRSRLRDAVPNEGEQIAHGLIQGYCGPDHKIMDIGSFYRALVQALAKAHQAEDHSLMDAMPKELIKEHIFYEVWMLGSTRGKLLKGDHEDRKISNALIESFWVHARNLNEFFLETGKGDTLKASEFATRDYQPPKDTEERKAPFKKVNKQISHLTRKRTSVPHQKVNGTDIEAIYKILFADLQNFHRHLEPELRSSWGIIFAEGTAEGEGQDGSDHRT
jgi:hypothetical protein